MPRHVDLTPFDGIHGTVAGFIADAAEQAAGIVRDYANPGGRPLASDDVGKVFQRSDSGTWLGLYSLAPLSFWVMGSGVSTSFSHVLTQDLDVDGFNVLDAGAYLPRVAAIPYASSVNVNVGVRCAHTIAPLNGDIAIALTNPVNGASGTIELRQDGVGGRDLTGITCAGRAIKMLDSPGTLQVDQTALAVTLLSYEVRADYVLIGAANAIVDATYGAPSGGGGGGGGAALSNAEPPAIGAGTAGSALTAARGDHTHDLAGLVSGDLTGQLPSPVVSGFQGRPFLATAPDVGQVIKWNGAAWEPAADNAGSGGGGGGSFVTQALTFAASLAPNFANVDRFTLALTGNCVITGLTNVPEHGCQLAVTHIGGPFALTWPTTVRRPAGETLDPHPSGTTMYSLALLGGTVYVSKAPGFETNVGASNWSALSVMPVVNPMDYGAVGNGTTDDTAALESALLDLPTTGGIMFLPTGRVFRKTSLITVERPHTKIWAPNRQAEIFATTSGNTAAVQTIRGFEDGFGLFGVKLRSDATLRRDTFDDHMISASANDMIEIVGCEIDGSAAAGIFLAGTTRSFICGNYVHHTWADHIHHTDVARQSWCWENWINNNNVSLGDDGIALVTYEPTGPLGGDMEWWRNIHLGSYWGRGYSVIGGELVNIHHNWAIGVAGAGIIIATEPAFDSNTCQDITARENWVTECAHVIGHPGILISGANENTAPIDDISLIDNISAGNTNANYAQEGDFTDVTNVGMIELVGSLPTKPTLASLALKDTSILMTRDVSHVATGQRPGLYRIHVREAPGGSGFQQRFEYIVKGTPTDVTNWVSSRVGAGDYLSEQQTVSGTAYALLLCSSPVSLGSGVSAVTHEEMRAGDQVGSTGLSWLWNRVNTGSY